MLMHSRVVGGREMWRDGWVREGVEGGEEHGGSNAIITLTSAQDLGWSRLA